MPSKKPIDNADAGSKPASCSSGPLDTLALAEAEAKALERDLEPLTRFVQALKDLEQAAARYRDYGDVQYDAIAQAFTAIDVSYLSAARFLERHGIDSTPLLVWVSAKSFEGIARLGVLIQWALLSAQSRGEQMLKLIAVARDANLSEETPASAVCRTSLDARALAIFLEHLTWSKKQIAEHLRCHPKSLAPRRCPRLHGAIQAYRSPLDPGRRRLHGTKDDQGNLEAWEEDEE